MFPLKVFLILLFIINITYSMYYLTNFHAHYPDARVIIANCGDTIQLSCQTEIENNSLSIVPIIWFRLYENAYPQPLILGDRQLIDDQRFIPRTQNNDHYLEIADVRKDDEGYYLCKSENGIQISYNLTILSNTCIDIVPNRICVTIDEPIHLMCRIHSMKNPNEVNLHVEWTRDNYLLDNLTEYISNDVSVDGILYETLLIKHASRNDTGIYTCRYGQMLIATAQVIVNQYPSGSKSRRLISQLRGNNSSSKASLRTVVSCFYIVYQIVLVALVALS
ncbi:unnamed protein product [Rotaria sordida]|uniref:Ig-like domain-containing protein n=1 Tax=Rotaria sordida TaxID=392033 RepID=A0A814H8F2_9BILA|nr:unnamed protein product [Rotaria sordida]CAF1006272.1 unnamed protein product [Rotaria sordida]CAF1007311.1 unnamed protein product [Rotaria sordida]